MASVSDLIVGTGLVRNRKLFIRNRKWFDQQVAQLRETWELEITISRLRATRSQQANRYYWGVVLHLISEHTGDTPEDLHDYFKTRFLPKKLSLAGDELDVVVGGSTRTMNTSQFYAYVEQVRTFAGDFLNLEIPLPDEVAA